MKRMYGTSPRSRPFLRFRTVWPMSATCARTTSSICWDVHEDHKGRMLMRRDESFKALVIEEKDGRQRARMKSLALKDLPDYEVLVEVAYSTLNYKDGLAVTGRRHVARRTPMVAGIDLAGTVVESRSPDWTPGDKVIVNGWRLSEEEWGGYSRYQRLRPEWLIRLPEAFSLEQAMAIGTAGYTAALCVDALEHWGLPHDRNILVTGA